MTFDARLVRKDFPILRADGPRAPAGLPRLRRVQPEAHRGAGRHAGVLRAPQHQRPPRRAPAGDGGDRPLRGRARARSRASSAPTRGVWSSPRTPPRRSTSSPTPTPAAARPRRRAPGHADGAPRQPRALAAGRAGRRVRAALRALHARRPAGPRRVRRHRRDRAGQAAGRHRDEQRARAPSTPSPSCRPRSRPRTRRRGRGGRRRAERPAPADRPARAGRRLPGVLQPQDARPDRRRCAGRATPTCWSRCRRSWAAAR